MIVHYLTKDIMDFWRSTYSDVAFVDGKYSNEQYLEFFNNVSGSIQGKNRLTLEILKQFITIYLIQKWD